MSLVEKKAGADEHGDSQGPLDDFSADEQDDVGGVDDQFGGTGESAKWEGC